MTRGKSPRGEYSRLSSADLLSEVKEFTAFILESTGNQRKNSAGRAIKTCLATTFGDSALDILASRESDTGMDLNEFCQGESTAPEPEADKQQVFSLKIRDSYHPVPVCAGHDDTKTGFHILFQSLKKPDCTLQTLYLNQCITLRQAEYFACIGEALCENKSLETLKIDNMFNDNNDARIKHLLPVILSLRKNCTLVHLDLGQTKMELNSDALMISWDALAENKRLKILNISGWKFTIDLTEQDGTKLLQKFRNFLKNTQLRQLIMIESCINVRIPPCGSVELKDIFPKLEFNDLINNSLDMLNVLSVTVNIDNGSDTVRKYKIREFIRLVQFKSVSRLNIAEDVEGNNVPVDDLSLCKFFEALKLNYPNLTELNMGNWVFDIKDQTDTKKKLKAVLPSLKRLEELVLVNLDKELIYLDHQDQGEESRSSHTFLLKLFLKKIPKISKMNLIRCFIPNKEITNLCKILTDIAQRRSIKLGTKFMPADTLREIKRGLDKKFPMYNYNCNEQTGEIELVPRPTKAFNKIKLNRKPTM